MFHATHVLFLWRFRIIFFEIRLSMILLRDFIATKHSTYKTMPFLELY